ncbi:MAG: methyl-accepting chemotaxis protein [Chloroflexia bacterium]|nr:methyl-accepting chemotaxis protein [Chloroflexia bacterium]
MERSRWNKLSPRHWPIAWKLSLAILAILLMALFLLSLVGDQLVRDSLLRGQDRELLERGMQQAERIRRFRDENLHNLYLAARQDAADLTQIYASGRRQALHEVLLRLGNFYDLSLIDLQGNVIDSTNTELIREGLGPAVWLAGLRRGAAGISYIQAMDDLDEKVFVYYTPIWPEQGDIELALIGRLRPTDTLWELVDAVRIRQGGYAFMIDDNKVTIAHGVKDETGQAQHALVFYAVGYTSDESVVDANKVSLYGSQPITREAQVPELTACIDAGVPAPSLEEPSANMCRYYFARQQTDKTSALLPIGEPRLDGISAPLEIPEWYLGLTVSDEEFLEPLGRLRLGLALASGAMILLALLGAVLFSQFLTRPIRRLAELAGRVQGGAYDERVQIQQEDEIGLLGRALNAMLDRLAESLAAQERQLETLLCTASGVRQDAGMVSSSAEELAAATEELNASAEEVTATVHEMARDAYEQMNQVQRTAESLQELDGDIQQLRELAQQLENASGQMRALAAGAGQAVGLAQENSQRIEAVVRSIEKFSRQTNLLALNATIEAARAGESGQSFAVVADEVRRLAENSRQALADVGALNEAIQQSMQTIQKTTGQTGRAIGEVVDLAELLAQTAGRQAQASRSLVQYVNQLAAIAEKNAAGSEQMAAAVEEQTAAFGEVSLSSQEMAALSLRLRTLARQLVAEQSEAVDHGHPRRSRAATNNANGPVGARRVSPLQERSGYGTEKGEQHGR